MRDKGGFRSIPGLEEVDTSLPPRNTRAFIRGLGVHALGAIECRTADVGWARLKAPGVPEFKMLDPYKHDPAAIQEWLSNF